MTSPYAIRRLGPEDLASLGALAAVFGEAFEEVEAYTARPPRAAYLERLLAREGFIALAAHIEGAVAGGLVAYEFVKFEQERSEFYLYDLAVAAAHRRRGVATALIARLREIARARGADVIFVQAYASDAPAIALYERFGDKEGILHFEIDLAEEDPASS